MQYPISQLCCHDNIMKKMENGVHFFVINVNATNVVDAA